MIFLSVSKFCYLIDLRIVDEFTIGLERYWGQITDRIGGSLIRYWKYIIVEMDRIFCFSN